MRLHFDFAQLCFERWNSNHRKTTAITPDSSLADRAGQGPFRCCRQEGRGLSLPFGVAAERDVDRRQTWPIHHDVGPLPPPPPPILRFKFPQLGNITQSCTHLKLHTHHTPDPYTHTLTLISNSHLLYVAIFGTTSRPRGPGR